MSLLLVDRDGTTRVVRLVLNRPERMNALNKELLGAFDAQLKALADDEGIGCIVITGAGERAFSAGADINEQAGFTPADAYAHMRWGQALFSRLEEWPVPTIAAINGYALGGGLELALACDMRLATRGAQLGLPEVTLANLPGWGGTQRLPRLIGAAKAGRMAFTGDRFAAERCEAWGLVDEVFEDVATLQDKAMALAAHIASRPRASLAAIKQVIRQGLLAGEAVGMELEARAVERLWGCEAQAEAQRRHFDKGRAREVTP